MHWRKNGKRLSNTHESLRKEWRQSKSKKEGKQVSTTHTAGDCKGNKKPKTSLKLQHQRERSSAGSLYPIHMQLNVLIKDFAAYYESLFHRTNNSMKRGPTHRCMYGCVRGADCYKNVRNVMLYECPCKFSNC